jgi:hypothetical protein
LPLSCKEADFDMLQILDIFQCSTCHFLSKLISPCSKFNIQCAIVRFYQERKLG